MSRRKRTRNIRALIIGLLVTVGALASGLLWIPDLKAVDLVGRLIFPLARLMVFIGIGLMAAQVVEAGGWTRKLGCLAGPLFRFAHLGSHCSAAFTAAFFSGVAANAMLLDFYKEAEITRRHVFLTNFMNQLPAYFLHLPMTFFIVVPLTRGAGLLYFGLTLLATLLRTTLFALFGHIFMPIPSAEADPQELLQTAHARTPQRRRQPFWTAIRQKLPRRFGRVLAFVVPAYAVVYVLSAAGAFDWLQTVMAQFAVQAIIPVEALSVVVLSFASEFTAGFATAGALMDAGALTVKQTVIALLLGNIIAFPIRALRHQLPRYMGIFAPGMGLQMLLMGQGFRVASIVVVAGGYWIVG